MWPHVNDVKVYRCVYVMAQQKPRGYVPILSTRSPAERLEFIRDIGNVYYCAAINN